MQRRHLFFAALLSLCLAASSGCVRREMLITSDPAGATVDVNQTWHGTTPFTLRFKHYGVYDIRLQADGYYPLHVKEPVKAPAYEQMGADFVSEVLVPARIQDKRELHYKLEKIEKEDNIDDILARSAEMRTESTRVADERRKRDESRDPKELPLPTKKDQRESKKGKREKAAAEGAEEAPVTEKHEKPAADAPPPAATDAPPDLDGP